MTKKMISLRMEEEDIEMLNKWAEKISDASSFKTIIHDLKLKNDRVVKIQDVLTEIKNNPLLRNEDINNYIWLETNDLDECLKSLADQKERIKIIQTNMKYKPSNHVKNICNEYIYNNDMKVENVIEIINEEYWLKNNTNYDSIRYYSGKDSWYYFERYKDGYDENEDDMIEDEYQYKKDKALVDYICKGKDLSLIPEHLLPYTTEIIKEYKEEIEEKQRKNNKISAKQTNEIENWIAIAVKDGEFITPELPSYMRHNVHVIASKYNLVHTAIRTHKNEQSVRLAVK